MKQVFVVYETDAWHTIANRDCKGIYTSKRSAIKTNYQKRTGNELSDTGLFHEL